MIDFIAENQATWWFVLGCILLAIEIIVLGFSTAVLLFVGLGAIVTAGLMWLGLLPATWVAGLTAFAICSAVVAAVLWKPPKGMQADRYGGPDSSSDLIGHEFRLEQDLSASESGITRYSGIEWRVELDERSAATSIAAGEMVAVSNVSTGVFKVMKPSNN